MEPPYFDPYAILGIAPTADLAEIKKVYRHLAKHHHPDLNPLDARAVSRFQEINQAYQWLLDYHNSLQNPVYPGYYPPAAYSGYYYPPQAPPQSPQSQNTGGKAPDNDFQAYSWETIEFQEEEAPPPPKTAPPPPKPEPEAPKKAPSGIPWREDMLKVLHEESFQVAKDRVLRKKFSPEEQLHQEILVYLLRGKATPKARKNPRNR